MSKQKKLAKKRKKQEDDLEEHVSKREFTPRSSNTCKKNNPLNENTWCFGCSKGRGCVVGAWMFDKHWWKVWFGDGTETQPFFALTYEEFKRSNNDVGLDKLVTFAHSFMILWIQTNHPEWIEKIVSLKGSNPWIEKEEKMEPYLSVFHVSNLL